VFDRKRIRLPIAAGLMALLPPLAAAAPADAPAKPAAEPKVVELRVTPQAAPVPALRYRLMPLESERTPGDAAPIYIRLGVGMGGAGLEQIEKSDNEAAGWMEKPLDQFPTGEARTLVNRWSSKLEQLDFGARRRTCDWNYTIPEQRERSIEILLPDVQEIRRWARLLALRARVEVAEHRYEDAARTVETGLSLGRHVARGGFVINALVGVAIANLMLERLEELVTRPDAPNLYWSLTALPRPLIGMREPMETEAVLYEWLVPELADPDRPRTDAEWTSVLARLHARLVAVGQMVEPIKPATGPLAKLSAYAAKVTDFARFRAGTLPEATEYARGRLARGAATSDDEAIVRYLVGRYRELRDEWFKASYLPYPEATRFYDEAERRIKEVKAGPLRPLVAFLAASLAPIRNPHRAEALLDRRVAALRVVEALRLHAAASGGKLPDSPDRVTIVPIPRDPTTGAPFEYRRDGEAAVLPVPKVPDIPASMSREYRVTLRR